MSMLVAAMTRTKNKFTSSLHKSESKVNSGEKQAEINSAAQAVATDVGEAAAEEPAGPSEAEDTFPTELQRQLSTFSCHDSEDEECESAPVADESVLGGLGTLVSLKEQLEKDKEDESLRRWKEQLLGSSAHLDSQVVEPEVKFLTLGMTSPGRPAIRIPLPLTSTRGVTFSLKEGSVYRLEFTFTVLHNIVSGLKYVHTVWKGGLQVDHTKIMLGTFSPQHKPYTQVMDEETTPSGLLARGSYTAKTKFVDDDEKCYLEIDYSFDIRKEWTHHRRGWSLGAF
ncbi:unnamed protein product [Calypogeia fissa]